MICSGCGVVAPTQHLRSTMRESRMKHSGEATLSNDTSAEMIDSTDGYYENQQ